MHYEQLLDGLSASSYPDNKSKRVEKYNTDAIVNIERADSMLVTQRLLVSQILSFTK